MNTHVQQRWWFVVTILLGLGLFGCNRDDGSRLTMPETSTQEIVETAAHPGNFNVAQGISDEFGAYVGHGEFVVQVPAGEYLLEYTTDLGTFYLVVRATASSLLYIGLQPGDVVHDAIVYTGTIIATSEDAQEHGDVTLFVWPGSARPWHEVFRMS